MSEKPKMRIPVAYAAGIVIFAMFVVNIVVDETALADQERSVRVTAKAIISAVLAVIFVLVLGRINRS